jgi:membrane protein
MLNLRGVVSLFKQTFSDWIAHDAQTMGASLAYYTVLSLAPLIVVATAIAGLVFSHDAVTGQLTYQLRDMVGSAGAEVIQNIVKNAKSPFTGVVASVIGLITLLFGASGVFTALRTALNRIWDVKTDPASGIWHTVRQQFLSFGMVLAIGFLLLVSLLMSASLAAIGKFVSGLLPVGAMEAANFLVSLAVITLLFGLIYRVLPQTTIPWSDVWIGGAFTALLFTLGKLLIGLYLGKASVGSAYGAAGSLVALLVWVYYSAQVFLFGAEFTHVYAHERGSRKDPAGEPAMAQPS